MSRSRPASRSIFQNLVLTAALPLAFGACTDGTSSVEAIMSGSVTAISSGAQHSCAVIDGGLKCWGANDTGVLGASAGTASAAGASIYAPGSGVTAVAAGLHMTCAIVNGAVNCWGMGANGRLGNGGTADSSSPVAVSGISDGATAIAAGGTDGTLMSPTPCVSAPAVINPSITACFNMGGLSSMAGGGFACAVVNGGVKCWGANAFGQLGDQSTTDRSTPVEVFAAGSGATSIAAGGNFACAIVGGAVKCWGGNIVSQLGSTSLDAKKIATPIASGATAIALGSLTGCAIMDDGSVSCWGYNASGEAGSSSALSSPVSSPKPVVGLGGAATALAAGPNHFCALIGDSVQCWGANGSKNTGDADTTNHAVYTAVAAGSGISMISAGGSTVGMLKGGKVLAYSCAASSGSVSCWGDDSLSQLGGALGAAVASSASVSIPGLF